MTLGPRFSPLIPLLFTSAALAVTGCTGDADDDDSPTPTDELTPTQDPGTSGACIPGGTVEITAGEINEDTLWDCTDAPYLISDDLFVGGGATLTIGPEVIVQFTSQAGLFVGTNSAGAIVADGTDAAILFTSDDGVGSAEQWEGIYLDANTTSAAFTNVTVAFAGEYTNEGSTAGEAAMHVVSTEVSLSGCTFESNHNAALRFTNGGHAGTFVGNTFRSTNGPSIHVEPEHVGSLGGSHTFDAIDSVLVHGGAVESSATWANLGAPYDIADDVFVGGSASPALTVSPGVTLRFHSGAALIIGKEGAGSIDATGTSEGRIIFTSLEAVPAAGDWEGVIIDGNSLSARFQYADFAYAGEYQNEASSPGEAAILVNGATTTITDCGFNTNAVYGVSFINGGAAAEFHNNQFTNSDGAGVQIGAGEVGTLTGPNAFEAIDRVEVQGGTVAADALWSDLGAPYRIEDDVFVGGSAGATLTVGPGATLLFKANAGLIVGKDNLGGLVADGCTTPVVFGSIEPVPSEGAWEGIVIDGNANRADLSCVFIQHAGEYSNEASGATEAALTIMANTFSLTNSTFTDNATTNVDIRPGARATSFQDNTFAGGSEETAILVRADAAHTLGTDNEFDAGDVVVIDGGVMADTGTWSNTGAPFRISKDAYVEGSLSPVLTLMPTVTLEFESNAALIIGKEGAAGIIADGSTGGITLTSAQPVKAAGDWEGLIIDGNNLTASTVLTEVTLEYCGEYSNEASSAIEACLGVINTSVTATDCTIGPSSSHGVQVLGSGSITHSGLTFTDIAGDDIDD